MSGEKSQASKERAHPEDNICSISNEYARGEQEQKCHCYIST